MICPICSYRNLDLRNTCRRCGASLRTPTDKTLGDDEPREAPDAEAAELNVVLDLDDTQISREPARPAPARPAEPERRNESGEALRARALTAGDRDPQHAAPAPVIPPAGPAEAPPGPLAGSRGAAGLEEVLRPAPGTPPPPAGARPTPSVVPLPPAGRGFAGFWVRFLAYVVDWTILIAVLLVMVVAALIVAGEPALVAARGEPQPSPGLALLNVFWNAIILVYFVFFASVTGATPGKMALRLKVLRADGTPVGAGRALVRTLGYAVEVIPGAVISSLGAPTLLKDPLAGAAFVLLGTFLSVVGYLWAGIDARKQALHDKMAGTIVVRIG